MSNIVRLTRHQAGRAISTDQTIAGAPTVLSAYEDFLASVRHQNRSPRTLEGYEHFLYNLKRSPKGQSITAWLPLVPWCKQEGIIRVDHLTREVIQNYLNYVQALTTDFTFARIVDFVKRYLRYCVDQRYLHEMPLKLKPPKVPKKGFSIFTEEEVSRIWSVVENEPVRDRAIFMLLVCTGIRRQEISELIVEDFRFDSREVVVRAEVAKSRRERMLPMGASYQALRAYWGTRENISKIHAPYFFLAFTGTPTLAGGKEGRKRTVTANIPYSNGGLLPNGFTQLVKKWGKLAGLNSARCTPHTFRHYFAITFLRNGGSLLALKAILGHTDFETVEIYAQLASVDIHKASRDAGVGDRFIKKRYQRAVQEKTPLD
jgi:integrase/recombinase XerD